MLEKILIFILFLGPLIFFHELGHFLFARFFGVRVEVFSIGFGPKILRWQWGETQFVISIIPLGGYIKMFGENPLEENKSLTDEEKAVSFDHKRAWAKFWIVFGGPLANFILAFFIFWGQIFVGEQVPEIKVGQIPSQSILYKKGLQSGDVLKKVNDKNLFYLSDLPITGDTIEHITVARGKRIYNIEINLLADDFMAELKKYPPLFKRPVVVNAQGEQFILSLQQNSVDENKSLSEIVNASSGEKIYFFKTDSNLLPIEKVSSEFVISLGNLKSFLRQLAEKKMRPLEMVIKAVSRGNPADMAGILRGDIVVGLNGQEMITFQELKSAMQEVKEEKIELSLWRKGELKVFTVKPTNKKIEKKLVKVVGIVSSIQYQKTNFIKVPPPESIFESVMMAFSRTKDSFAKILQGIKKLLIREISFDHVAGPIRMGQVASDFYNTSIAYFFQLMAMVSINLGIINLFPIPILDGGRILLIFLEVLNRGPLPRKKVEVAQYVGFALMMILMVGVIFNDVLGLYRGH